MRRIINIEKDGEEECQCILISDEEHLYLTEDHIVTIILIMVICLKGAIRWDIWSTCFYKTM